MQIIPVLDLLGGLVVRGVMGDRANYRPIETPLSPDAEPRNVAAGLQGLGPFPAFYLADLDAIAGRAPNEAAVLAVAAQCPQAEIWVDAGIRTARQALALLAEPGRVCVLGSETLAGRGEMEALAGRGDVVLSLDFRGDAFLGDSALLEDAGLWPGRIVVMTLAKVGSGAGPDLDKLTAVKARAGGRAVYAAGGVRGPGDVAALEAAGIAGALVASALHDGRLAGPCRAS
ncbi:HisA/HisF-related TIM barrel protein [Aurantimonas sp. Leaf443]|uniref:HisA/HisF-related TIM barrel protein n=1 Tax=Aurantimonas sp. Leaf443 TaxID=1736378 RepID=UPI0006F5DE32|nr:HisA/HisF-related TIM barrel protein [Aurantimonas sp. Leaf443]KQT85228.1 nickel transporter [Aurantimonas sp. Leaf443]